MKKLQSNYTTPEQSKRLLKLGVPADSADAVIIDDSDYVDDTYYGKCDFTQYEIIITDQSKHSANMEDHECQFEKALKGDDGFLPCWSVGRLVEIYTECVKETETFSGHMILTNGWTVDSIIDIIAEDTELGCMDFSKLED